MNVATACWRDTEGATATENSVANVEVDLTATGKVTSIRVRVFKNRFPGFRACIVTKLSQFPFGEGAEETLFSTVPLVRSFPKRPAP
jgi:hypothetical protein